MTSLRSVARALAAAVVLVAGLVVGGALREARERTAVPTGDPAALSAPTASPSATSRACDQLSRVAPSLAPPLAVSDLGNGMQELVSAEGGWTVTVPAAWQVTPGALGLAYPQFGQAHITSYDPKTAPTPDPERWILPPSVGITFDVQVWMNPDREALDAYAQRVFIGPDQKTILPGAFTRIGGQNAYRFTIQDEHRFQRGDGTLVVTRQTRIAWIVQSARDDRVVVAYAAPGESAPLPTVESAMATMRITMPVASRRPVTHQRDEILKQWLYDKSGTLIPGRRAEAKLLTYDEASAALIVGGSPPPPPGGPRPLRLLRIDHDPDDLYWVVAVSGPDLPEGRRAPPGPPGTSIATARPTTWILYDTSASGDNTGSTGGQYATQGTWPLNFDALPDRCR